MTYRKKLIEVALPLEAINEASVRESYIYKGNPSSIHKWWAQRPLAASRAVVFASLVDDPNSPEASPEFVNACQSLHRGRNAAENDTPRQRLFDFVDTLVQWESTTDEQVLETARQLIRLSVNDDPPPLLDPFAGGGTIPLEGQRLGLKSIATDLNPVAVLLCKSLLEIPNYFANLSPVNPKDQEGTGRGASWRNATGLAADLRYYGQRIRDGAWERIGDLYPIGPNGEEVIAWLWARTVKSPNPALDVNVPLVRSFWLSKKKHDKAWIEPQVDSRTKRVSFEVYRGKGKAPSGTMSRHGGRCIVSNVPIPFEYIRSEGSKGRIDSQLMAIVTESRDGRNFYSPTDTHEQAARVPVPDGIPDTNLPEQALGFRVQNYGIVKHHNLFTPRQIQALQTLVDLVDEVREVVREDALAAGLPDDNVPLCEGGRGARAYSEAIAVYLAFAIDKYAMYGCAFVPWYAQESRPSMLFSRQAISMVWDYTEVNPFSSIGGSFIRSVEIVADALEPLGTGEPGLAYQADAAKEDFGSELWLVSTDPPYYDNIGYADLSDFFYVWLRRSLRAIYPDIFATLLTPKMSELIAAPFRFDGDSDRANRHFEEGLKEAFTNVHQIAHPDYPVTIYYAFKQSEIVVDEADSDEEVLSSTGWETMLEGLVQAGFTVNGTWPIRTERSGRMRDFESNALASSIILVCRSRPEDAPMISRREFVNALRQELPAALREMQSGNIAPVDLAQASIGPGMAVYSRYSKVLEPNGDRLTVRTALQIINYELGAYLAEQEGYIDEDSRFAVAWFEQFGFNEGPFGQADVLARAKNTSVDGLAYAGVLESGAGKVRLYHWSELDAGWDPATDKRLTVWEATHHLIERLNVYGEEGAARLLAKMPPNLAAEARQLAYRLYSICERKGWAEQARDYNALVISWGASQEQAREFKEQYQQGKLF